MDESESTIRALLGSGEVWAKEPDASERKRLPPGVVRVGLLMAALVAAGVVAKLTGWSEALTVARLRALVESAGAWSLVAYVGLFCGCYLLTVPGMVFVAVGVAAFGPWLGGPVAYGAALAAISGNFWAGRRLGGETPRLPWRFARTALEHLEERPVRTIALLRLVLMLTPPFDYGLGLTAIPYPRFLLGSAIGLIPPIAVATVFVDALIRWLGG